MVVQILVLLEAFGYPTGTDTPLYMAMLLTTYCTNLITPVVYAVKYKEFRHATALLLSCDTDYQRGPGSAPVDTDYLLNETMTKIRFQI